METDSLNQQEGVNQYDQLAQLEDELLDTQVRKLSQSSKGSQSSTQICLKKQNSIQQKQDANPQKRKKANGVKKIKKQKQKKNNQVAIYKLVNSEDVMKISTGFTINKQGIIKFSYEIAHVSFGDHQIEMTNFLQNEQIFQIHLINSEQKPSISVEQALEYILHTPCKYVQEARNALLEFKQIQRFLFNNLVSNILNSTLALTKRKCFTTKQARVNFQQKDIDVLQSGYSKSFLDLIGLNIQNLSFLLLRNKKIDLFKDENEMMRQSLFYFTNNRTQQSTKTSYVIKTFDGFEIKLQQTKHQVFPFYETQKISKLPVEYIFFIIEFDVELEELQNLISYRQKILSNNLTFDEYINKELSLLFENVEYSVNSNSLFDKFYKDNLNYLDKVSDQKRRIRTKK
ncbi:hypothetical protein ABPG74_008001 [Tetrahymena malaccensis]